MIGLHMLHGPLQGTTQQGAFISSSGSQHSRDGSSGSVGISCLNQPNIVRIPAKTALPIISSVPKCRSSKASRHHPIETVNGSSVSHSATTTTSKTTSNRLGNINQADQVLLIVNDDHIKGGGVPIIGRRLPSKSIAMRSAAAYTTSDTINIQSNKNHSEPELVQIDYSMLPQTIELGTNQALQNYQQAPVVGRRSHRLIQQQQQQQQLMQRVYQQTMFDEQIIRQDSTKKANKNSSKQYDNQQPLSIVETRLAASQQVHHLLARPMPSDYRHQQQQQLSNHSSSGIKSAATNRHTKKLHPVKYQSISIMNIADPIGEYNLPPMQQVGGRGQKNYFQDSPNIQSSLYDKPKVSGRGGQVVTKQAIVTRGGIKGANNLTLGTVQSSSCSSLCSTTTATTTAAAAVNSTGCANKHANYPRCCSPATVCSSNSEQILDESYLSEKACCQPLLVEGEVCCEQSDGCSETTSCNDPSCNLLLARVQSCCMAIPPPVKPQKSTCTNNQQPKQQPVGKACTKLYNQQQQQQQQHELHHHHHHHHHHHDNSHGSHGRQARHITNNHHHHSCQANGSSIREISSKPSASHHCRSSSLHDSRRQLNNSTSQQQFNQPMLISGRNILPVHPKPNLSQSPLILSGQQQCFNNQQQHFAAQQTARKNRGGLNEPDNCTVVTQMYESLAAELKAKLGDPKMGPILLPPKDYDTMSRKQGRLTGIELRRSTNPQLVGPAASRLNSSSSSTVAFHHNNREDSINEEQIVVDSSVNIRHNSGITTTATTTTTTNSPTGSDRSSGRSQADERSLQRSRSNSSSGLGSISMGPSSPSSPPISSNEDMRQTTTQQKGCNSGKNFSTKVNRGSSNNDNDDDDRRRRRHHHHLHNLHSVDRKDSSPDNCNSSDSGHSGSGRLDSTMISEERKVLLRDKNHPKSSLATTTSNNNNNNNNDSNMPTWNISDKTGNDRISGAKPFKMKQSMVDHQNRVGDEAVSSFLSKGETRTREKTAHNHLNSTKISSPSLWNGRVEVPLKVNSGKNGNTYLATKQIIY